MDLFNSCVWISLILFVGFLYIKWVYSYWKRNQIPFIEPTFPFGNMQGFKPKVHLSQRMNELYRNWKNAGNSSPILGLYFFFRPILLIVDIDLCKRILITDFQYFQNRGVYYNEKDDPLSAHLFSLEYERWKPLRAKLTSTFTSGKMKFMFPTILSVSDKFVDCLCNASKLDSEVEMYDWLARFTTDIIGTCAFGIECNSMIDPDAKFRQMGRKVFEQPKMSAIERLLAVMCPSFAKKIGIYSHHRDVTTFFLNAVKETIAYREANNIQRNDFMSLLIGLKNSEKEEDQLTIHEIAAQAFVFFMAGFETSSTTLAFCLYELASNKSIQDKARNEIAKVIEKYDGQLKYETINEMTYIDQIINEAIRKHPAAGNMPRIATRDYKIPNTNFTIPKGMFLLLPVYGIHHDPEFYDNPEIFDPQRFEADKVKMRPSCSFIPFGDGPRNCIGLRFGLLQTKIGLVKLLQNFEFSPCSKTPTSPIKYNAKKLVVSPEKDMWLKISTL